MLTRRQLLQRGAIGGVGLLVGRTTLAMAKPAAVGVTPRLRKWVEPLPVPPVLDGRGGGKQFTIAARESTFWKFHPHLPPTRTWGYWSDDPAAGLPYLGPTILATSRPNDSVETSVTVDWRNELGNAFLPNDPTIMGAVMPGDPARMVTHLHGGENLPQFDGTPLQWFTKGGKTGPHYITNTFTYYNEQRASMVWYHDHALGNTRTNVYAGLAGAYIIRDDQDTGEPDNPLGLPAGPYEIPLVLQDKTFNADGSMFYPTEGVTAYHPQWVPEFFGDVAVINAKVWPFVDVEPRRYRLRIVNGSQSRFYNLRFVHEHSRRALPFTQIGAEGGLLRVPVAMTALLIAPGERADLIIDFAEHRHASFIVTNDARAPYPAGARATLTQLLKIRVNRRLQGVEQTTPPSRLKLSALAGAVAHARAAPLRDARSPHRRLDPPQRRGCPVPRPRHRFARGHHEAAGHCDRGLAAGQHDRRHAPDPLAPRDLRGDRPPAVRCRRLRPREEGDHLHRAGGARRPERERPQGHRPGPPRTGHPHPRQIRPSGRGHDPTPARRRRPAIRLALPHPRARRERHDARVRGRPVNPLKDGNFPPLVTTATNGENGGWFRNTTPGSNFWSSFHAGLMEKVRAGRSGGIRPTFISDYLERHGPHGWVTVRPGAWNTGTGFVQWTGSLAQQQALTRVAALSEAVHAARRNAIAIGAGNPDLYRHLEDALTLVLRAETSCNFSWGEARVQRCHDDLDQATQHLERAERLFH